MDPKQEMTTTVELNSTAATSAQTIVNLINTLSSDSFDENDFDCKALLEFFNQPTINVPNEWIADWPRITQLVNQAIQRFPSLKGIDFNLATH